MRVTKKELEAKVTRLNKILNRPETPYTRNANGTFDGNVGHIKLDHAPIYGGYILREMEESTGESTFGPLSRRVNASEMATYIDGIIFGIRTMTPMG